MSGEEMLDTARGSFGIRRTGDRSAPLVLCVHGFPDDASTFDGLAESLADGGYQVAAVYLRGYHPPPLEGPLALDALVEDLLAVTDTLAPGDPAAYVGHDFGAQLGYAILLRYPSRFRAAVLLAGAHPASVARNSRRLPRQLWMSRYIVFFQLGPLADRAVARNDFAAVDRLWRRWAPGFDPPSERLAHVKQTLRARMPGPVAMYRAGGFNIGTDLIGTPTLFITGADDGCVRAAVPREWAGGLLHRRLQGAGLARGWPLSAPGAPCADCDRRSGLARRPPLNRSV